MEFFEGAEKRLVIRAGIPIELLYDTNNWKKILDIVGCTILSILKNTKIIMFLLAESILLIKDDIIILKTCGKTSPLNLLEYFQKQNISIRHVEYSHPQFLKAELQAQVYHSFDNEINYIKEKTNNIIEYKSLAKLHMYYTYSFLDRTIPIYEITLWNFNWNKKLIEELHCIFIGWHLDEYYFEPDGYSMNGYDENHHENYITIHVTPNKSCSYLSIETNNLPVIILIQNFVQKSNPKKIGLFSNICNFDLNFIPFGNSETYLDKNIFIKYYS